jgi:hypothetical protein
MISRPGPLNGVGIGDILLDRNGVPWRFHSLDWDSGPPFAINVAWVWKQEEDGFARSHVYPHEIRSVPREGFRIASPLDLLALVEAGYVLEV